MVAAPRNLLATGHLGRDEIFAIVDAAREEGVAQIVITHPEFPSQDLSCRGPEGARRARRAARALLHHAPHRQDRLGGLDRQHPRHGAGAFGAATDLGQIFNPEVEDGMGLMVDRLLDAGLNEEEVHVMAVENTRRVAGCQMRRANDRDRGALGGLRVAVGRRRRGQYRNGGAAKVIALSYGERGESGELWKQEGQTVENVKRGPPRRGRASGRRARRGVRVPGPRRLSAPDRHRCAQPDRRQDPRVRARCADHAHRHRPLQPRPPSRVRRVSARAPGRRRRRCKRVRDGDAAGAVPVRAPSAGAVQLHAHDVRGHHRGDREEARGDG